MAQTHIYRRFAWQAWDRWHWVAWHKLTSTVVLRGRRRTDGTGWRAWTGLGAPWSRVTPRHSAWQAWHLVTFTFVLRGRRGTNSHLPSFCVAGVGQMALGGVLGVSNSSCVLRLVFVSNCKNVTRFLCSTRKSRRVCRMPVSTLTSFHVLYRFVLEQ